MGNSDSTAKVNIPTSRLVFYIGTGLIFLLIIIRNLLKINLPVISILLVVIVIAAFGTKTEIIALAISCIPLATAFQYKYAILAIIFIFLIKYGKEVKITWVILPVLLMFIWELLHALGYTFSIVEFLRGFTEIILCTILLLVSLKDVDYKFVVKVLSFFSIFVMTIMLLSLLIKNGFNIAAIFEGQYRFGTADDTVENYGLNFNANQLGLICNLSIIGLLQLILQNENNKIDYICIVVLALFGVMTLSRTFVFCLLLEIVLFLFSRKEPITKKIKKFLIILVSLTVIILLAFWLMPSVVESFYERFNVDDITNSRGDLMIFYNKHIFSSAKHSLFGLGLQGMLGKLTSIYGTSSIIVPHNGIQEILVAWGVLGLLLFVMFILAMVLTARKNNKLSLSAFIPLIIILIAVQAGQLITSGTALLGFAFSFVSLVCVEKR